MQTTRPFALVALALLAVLAAPAHAQVYTWTAAGENNDLTNLANWTDGSGQPANDDFLEDFVSVPVFGNAGTNVNMNAVPATVYGSYVFVGGFNFTRAISLDNGTGGPSSFQIVTYGSGITVTSAADSGPAGIVQINGPWLVGANSSISNNSSREFLTANSLNGFNGRFTLTNNGVGTNWVRLGVTDPGANLNFVQDSPTSAVNFERPYFEYAVDGDLTIKRGLVGWSNQGNFLGMAAPPAAPSPSGMPVPRGRTGGRPS